MSFVFLKGLAELFCSIVLVVTQVSSLTVEPNVLFVEEDWPLHKPLLVDICGDNIKQVRIVSGNDQGVFGVVPLSDKCGTLKLGKHLDADTIDQDGKRGQFFSMVFEEKNGLQRSNLDVQVVDVNDNPPQFLNLPAEIELSPQQSVVGSIVYTVEVKDPDTGIGGVSRFSISGTDKFGIINEKCSNSRCSAQLELKKPFETNKVEVLQVSARDGASITKFSNEKRALLKITGVPVLQNSEIYNKPNAPIFMTVFEGPLHISRNLRLSSKIVKVEAKSVLEEKNTIVYGLGAPSKYFDVDKNTVNHSLHFKDLATELTPTTSKFLGGLLKRLQLLLDAKRLIFRKIWQSISSTKSKNVDRTEEFFRIVGLYFNPAANVSVIPDINDCWIRLKKSLISVGSEPLFVNVTAKEVKNGTGTSSILLEVLVDQQEEENGSPRCTASHYTAVFNKISSKLILNDPIKVEHTADPNTDFRVVLSGKHSELFHVSPSKVRGGAIVALQVLNSQAASMVEDSQLQFQIELHSSDTDQDLVAANCSLTIKLFNPENAMFSTQPPNFSDQLVAVQTNTTSAAPTPYKVELEENSPAQVILQLNIPENVRTEISGKGSEYFAINNRGQLICLEALDAEQARQIDLDVLLMDEDGGQQQYPSVHVTVDVLDVNDNAPQFEQANYRFILPENIQAYFQVKAFDEDEEENAQLSYSIADEQSLSELYPISINAETGELAVGKLDVDLLKATHGRIEFRVEASDYGVPQLSNKTSVTIIVQPRHPNIIKSGPKFLQSKYDVVVECLPPLVNNYTLLTVKAVSATPGTSAIQYSVSQPAYFSITTSGDGAGELRLLQPLPKTANSEGGFKFEVVAKDAEEEARVPVTVYLKECPLILKPQAQATKTAAIQKLTNTSEIEKQKKTVDGYSKFDSQTPVTKKFVPWHYDLDLKENTPIGTEILKLEVPQLAQTAFGFELVEDNSKLLRLNPNGSIAVASKIDYEHNKEVRADVFAISDRQHLHFATVRVLVQDENDNKPIFRISNKHKLLLSEWTSVGTLLKLPIPLAEDADGSAPLSTIHYSLAGDLTNQQHQYFDINSTTSEVRLVRKLFVPDNELTLVIRATDNPKNIGREDKDNSSENTQNISEITLIVVVIRHSKDSLAKVLDSLPSRLEVFEDQAVGTVLTSLKAIMPQSFKLNIHNSEHFAVIKDGELKLAKSLRGFRNRTLCTQLQLDADIMKMNASELRLHTMMVCEEMGVIRNEINRINYELQHMNTTIADNEDRVKEHKYLPHLVSSIVEVLELEQTEPEEGANVDLDACKTTCAVIKTSTRLTIFLPSIGLVDPKQLKPSDLVAVHKDTYLILEKLPEEYDTRVKAMEVDERPTEQYSDIGGCAKQINEIVEAIVLPLTHKERFDKLGIHPPKGVLMYGPPGTGKTMMARAVAAQTKSTFLKLSGTHLVQMYIGDGAKLVRDAFALAKAKAPTIIFIDEIDAVGTKRFPSEKQGDREVQRTMMELLNQLDGFQPNDNIKVIAATNRVDVLDPALLRSGRLDRKIELPAPDEDARLRIMQIHSRKMNMSKTVNFEELARCTYDFNGAQCKAVCVESGMIALRRNSSEITHEDCMDAIMEVQAKKKKTLNYYA